MAWRQCSDHAAVAADAAHKVDGSTPALTGGVCERTPQVRDALVTHAQGRDAAVTDCSKVTETHLAAVGNLALDDLGLTALKAGDFADLSGVGTITMTDNALSALPAGVFEGAESANTIWLDGNALAEGGLPDGVFETLARLHTLRLNDNPGSASFVPRADAGEDLVLRTGETATLGGPGTGRDPWGTNADYAWVEVDAGGQRGGGGEAHGGPRGGGRGEPGLHRAGARRGAGAALPAHGDRQGGGDGDRHRQPFPRDRHGHGHGAGGAGGDGGGADVVAAGRGL